MSSSAPRTERPAETGLPPNDAYLDPAHLERERRSLMRSTWQFAGRASAIPEPGDVLPVSVAGAPVVLVRDAKGAVRVFDNVCPHRGTRLVGEPCSGRRTLVCPYHAWSFRLDGSLLARPHFHGAGDHDRGKAGDARPGLWPVRAEIWFDWIFVNLDGTAPPLSEVVAPIVERMGGYDFAGCAYGGEITFDVEANWKLAHENYLDVLHKFAIHPELEKAAPLRTNSPFEWMGDAAVVSHVLEEGAEGRGGSLPPLPGLSDELMRLGVAGHVFPNANFMYWRDQVVLFVCEAIAPDRTRERFLVYFAQDAMQDRYEAGRRQVLDTWRHLNLQDIAPLRWMQEGRRSVHFDGGTFSPHWDPQIVEYLRRVRAATA